MDLYVIHDKSAVSQKTTENIKMDRGDVLNLIDNNLECPLYSSTLELGTTHVFLSHLSAYHK